ncbi:hypothetical protein AB0E88_25770 [Streptomyces sp. NPDC028635]|uniref:hypothetical protein n=1 Tax=Streptomyces sp. NPDC028635 TaxID=3154800 RepID=UPI003401C7A4
MSKSREREEADPMGAPSESRPQDAGRRPAGPPQDAARRAAGGRTRRRCRTEQVLVVCGLGLLPWLVALAGGLPGVTAPGDRPLVWIGLDALEALGLITTGLLAGRGHRLHPLTATATATLLVADAWLDTMTATPGADRVAALAMAFGAELPLAVTCGVLAARGLARLAPREPRPDPTPRAVWPSSPCQWSGAAHRSPVRRARRRPGTGLRTGSQRCARKRPAATLHPGESISVAAT